MLLSQLFRTKEKTFSFEVFPANTPESHAKLLKNLEGLCALKPDFISCTYGAGGGNRSKTIDTVEHIQNTYGVPAMAHLTCIAHTQGEIKNILDEFKAKKINNILALRGDPPKDASSVPENPGFKYASDLVAFIRSHRKNDVSIGVAGFPEKHLLAPSLEADANYLKQKMDAGADFVITQLFFDNRCYFDYVKRLAKLGVKNPVLPGILPITDYNALIRFCDRCGATVPDKVHEIFKPIAGDPEKTLKAGIDFAVQQCRELSKGGAPGIHFYTLNRLHPVSEILTAIR